MKSLLIITGFLFSTFTLKAQIDTAQKARFIREIAEVQKGQFHPEVEAEFIGGFSAFYNYLQSNISYPEKAQLKNKEGIVYVYFVIDRIDGHARDVKVLKSSDKIFEEEAVRIISAMPSWIPGRQSGRNVNVSYTVPINFILKKSL